MKRFGTMIKKINRLLLKPLVWYPVDEKNKIFATKQFDADECWLQLNDFPDEPLWTLFFKGDALDIEDTPLLWKIK
ncbi:MAG: hypothetical protein J6S82_00415 [Bacteroidales bacterium]|nr:hypothetical protein [Bacteroidales bacterium]